jgi:hypothetical protein
VKSNFFFFLKCGYGYGYGNRQENAITSAFETPNNGWMREALWIRIKQPVGLLRTKT